MKPPPSFARGIVEEARARGAHAVFVLAWTDDGLGLDASIPNSDHPGAVHFLELARKLAQLVEDDLRAAGFNPPTTTEGVDTGYEGPPS